MTERNDNHYAAQRGDEARLVLTNPAYVLAMQTLQNQIVEQWRDCPIRDQEGQRLLLQLAKLAQKFEATLAGLVETGKLAKAKIDLDADRDEHGARKLMRRIL
jgi:hypothetical protein